MEFPKLSTTEKRAVRLYHLGGVDAWRPCNAKDWHTVSSKTVASLVRKGLFDKRGLTELGEKFVDTVIIPELGG